MILLGPPGAGKGTQAATVSDRLGVTKAASGDLFRAQRTYDTELGRLVRSYYDQGLLVPDDVTIKLIMEWINAPEQAGGFVLDGFPRTLPQAQALDNEIESTGGLDMVLHIIVSDDELIRRLGGRLICRDCQTTYHSAFAPPRQAEICDNCGGEVYQRADDAPEVVARRIQVYMDETQPLVQYYRDKGLLVDIDGERSIEEVGEALIMAVENGVKR